jgi:outer membrane receptor protein involved in Fe transport
VGTIADRASLSLSLYRNELENNMDFYAAQETIISVPPFRVPVPKVFSYRNVGKVVNQGIEVGLNVALARQWSAFANWSYQADPETEGIARSEINTPPPHRVNLGAHYDGGRAFANGNLNYAGEAFFTDVLDSRFWGPTEPYTQVNLAAGVRLRGGRLVLSVLGNNVFDARVQQHVFGDVLRRKITGELRLQY